MSIDIQKKLRTMTKSQLEEVCHKMKCPTGTKKEIVGHLLRPFGMKYKMDFWTPYMKEMEIQTWDKEELSDWALTFKNITDEGERELLEKMFLNELKRRGLNELERDKNLKKTKQIFGSTEQEHVVRFEKDNPP